MKVWNMKEDLETSVNLIFEELEKRYAEGKKPLSKIEVAGLNGLKSQSIEYVVDCISRMSKKYGSELREMGYTY